MNNPTTDFPLTKTDYVAFDAYSLRQLIVDRLNKYNVLTDQNFIGSNLSSVIDIIAFSYNTLIYYLNKTSTESLFSEAQLYDNINRIVKLIDYSPIGFQTSTLSFTASAQDVSRGLYTIPRYTYIQSGYNTFSFNEDITFVKTVDATIESMTDLAAQKLMYQGMYVEHPLYTALGDESEMFIFDPGSGVLADHFNIDVYIKKSVDGLWVKGKKTPSFYLESADSYSYEIRLNGNGLYEIKFGNDINGKKLEAGDQVAIYWLRSGGESGRVGPGNFSATSCIKFSTTQFDSILSDVTANQLTFASASDVAALVISNNISSSFIKDKETPDDIRNNAPSIYRGQYRLVTQEDYRSYITNNFGAFLQDVAIFNNWDYTSGYLQYFVDQGMTTPFQNDRALFNQVAFADSCNFNNVYIVGLPRTESGVSADYLARAQKELIQSSVQPIKMLNTEIVFVDPIFKTAAFGISDASNQYTPSVDKFLCGLYIVRDPQSRQDPSYITSTIKQIFVDYFSRKNLTLGQVFDIKFLSQQITGIAGVKTIYTRRILNDGTYIQTEGLYFFLWNEQQPQDKMVVSNNYQLNKFTCLYMDTSTLEDNIIVQDISGGLTQTEY